VATTVLISAFQHNLALIRAERFCNWLKRRAEAVQYISGAKYA
jgi:predicted deacetylase